MPDFTVTEIVRITADSPEEAEALYVEQEGHVLDQIVDGYHEVSEEVSEWLPVNLLYRVLKGARMQAVVIGPEDIRRQIKDLHYEDIGDLSREDLVHRTVSNLDLINDAVMEAVWEVVAEAIHQSIDQLREDDK